MKHEVSYYKVDVWAKRRFASDPLSTIHKFYTIEGFNEAVEQMKKCSDVERIAVEKVTYTTEYLWTWKPE